MVVKRKASRLYNNKRPVPLSIRPLLVDGLIDFFFITLYSLVLDMKTILIADDHEIVRLGVRMLIEGLPGNYNFIEAATCSEMLHVLSTGQAHYAILDVFLTDGNILSNMNEI